MAVYRCRRGGGGGVEASAVVVPLVGPSRLVPGTRQHLAVHRLVSRDARRARHAALRDRGPRLTPQRAQRPPLPARGMTARPPRRRAALLLNMINSNLHDVWSGGVVVRALDLRYKRSRLRISAVPLSGNNLGQVVHTHVPLSISSIIWYWPRGGDALRLGR